MALIFYPEACVAGAQTLHKNRLPGGGEVAGSPHPHSIPYLKFNAARLEWAMLHWGGPGRLALMVDTGPLPAQCGPSA